MKIRFFDRTKKLICSKWRKAKLAFGFSYSISDDSPPSDDTTLTRLSDVDSPSTLLSPITQSSSGLRLLRNGNQSSKICAICLTRMIQGHQDSAIFSAECSHLFHLHCITSNVQHGNKTCPVCRANWKELPTTRSSIDFPHDSITWNIDLLKSPSNQLDSRRQFDPVFHPPEPTTFDDDEVLDLQLYNSYYTGIVDVKTYPQVSAVPRSTSYNDFNVLIHLKAPQCIENSRAPVDLVMVLDVSASMSGTKLALLKRAMAFVVLNLGPSDRLSVISFSSSARRLFPLRRMTEAGRLQALRSVNSLFANGGTSIVDGLRKSGKVLFERKWKNPVSTIILLSDGQDNCVNNNSVGTHFQSDYEIPVHTFGLGADHDASTMHSISENSGGTFSFIDAEYVIQDAFAQCMGGILSVVIQKLSVEVECVHPNLHLSSIKAGSYITHMLENARKGSISIGDLYAEEEKDFIVTINIPVDKSCTEMSLLKVSCVYKDPFTNEVMSLEEITQVKIQRPEIMGQLLVAVEVERQRNRLSAAEAMADAKAAADNGDLASAVAILDSCRSSLLESASAGDRLCVVLCSELQEMQERMANRNVYEVSGRAYVLSGLSSHTWQRATARGDSTDFTSLVHRYQTPYMVDMVTMLQTMQGFSSS